MADFYVSTSGSDSNAGTAASPFRTILKASQAASSGSTVHVAPGTYTGGFQTTTSGVTYVSDVKWGAKIVPGSSNGRVEAWDNRGANVTIDGFEIDGSSPQGGKPWLFGIYTAGSNSVVQNVKVHDLVRDSAAWSAANTGGQGGAGIMGDSWTGGTNIKVQNSVVYNIGPSNTSSGLVHGIYMATSGSVLNNLVYKIVGDGITSWHDATNLKIINNTISEAHGAGILIGAGDHYKTSGPNDYSQVSNNILFNNTKGIEDGGQVGSHNTYTNNLVYGNGTNWALHYGSATATVNADPKFVNAGAGDYHLTSGSLAINAGTLASAPTLDLSGTSREGAVDIGAYEYHSTTPTPTPTPAPTPTPTPTPTPVTGASSIVISARGTPYNGVNAHFKVLVDGVKIGEGTATTTTKDYAFTANVTSGAAHKVQVQYDNDSGARDLYVEKFTVNGQSFAATSSMVTYDRGALDGKDVIAGQTGMWWNGTLVASLPASYFPSGTSSVAPLAPVTSGSSITVNAQGTAAAGVNAHFNLLIDGQKVGEGIAGSTAKDFTFNTGITADQAHKVQVQFDNDATVNGEDRNLIVNKVTINGKAVLPTASIVTYDRYALDGQDVLPGQSGMWWNGTLVIGADKSYFPAPAAAAAQLDVYDHLVTQTAPAISADAGTVTASAASFDLLTADMTHTMVEPPHQDYGAMH